MSANNSTSRPALVTWAFVVSLGLFLLFAWSAWHGPLALIPAVVLGVISFGIIMRKASAAYGGAMFLVAMLFALGVGASRGEITVGIFVGVAIAGVLFASIAILFWRTGRALAPFRPVPAAPWIGVASATVLFAALFQPFVVPSAGMENTILNGDQLLVRATGPAAPARGDVIAFRYPVDPQQSFIKRVVAVAGDRVHVQDKRLFLNGLEQKEPYAIHRTGYIDEFRDNFPRNPDGVRIVNSAWADSLRAAVTNGDIVVPPGKVFVMGDNRDNSLDSRYWGFVDVNDITGKPLLVYYSTDAATGKVRWNRILHRVS